MNNEIPANAQYPSSNGDNLVIRYYYVIYSRVLDYFTNNNSRLSKIVDAAPNTVSARHSFSAKLLQSFGMST
jgi:hypothetical protein